MGRGTPHLYVACNAGDLGSIPGLGRSPGEGKGYPLQYSGLENSMDCIVHWVTKSWTRLSNFHFTPSVSLGEAQSPFQFSSLMLYSLPRELFLTDCFPFLFFFFLSKSGLFLGQTGTPALVLLVFPTSGLVPQ